MTWLIARTGNGLSPALCIIAAAAVSLVAALSLRETAARPLAA